MALNAELDMGVFLSTENAEEVLGVGVDTGYVLTVDLDNSVAGLHAGLIGTASVDYLKHIESVVDHLELYAYAIEGAFEVASGGHALVGGDIRRVGVEVMEQLGYSELDEAVEVYRVDIPRLNHVEHLIELLTGLTFGITSVDGTSEPEAQNEENCCHSGQPEHILAVIHFNRCL